MWRIPFFQPAAMPPSHTKARSELPPTRGGRGPMNVPSPREQRWHPAGRHTHMRSSSTLIMLLSGSVSMAQLADTDFEQVWITSNGTVPAGWTAPFLGAGVTTDAHSGTYALQVWNWYYSSHGWAANGTSEGMLETNSLGGDPLDWKPQQLTGWYKYVPDDDQGAADSAVVRIILKRWNGQQADTVAMGEEHLGPSDSYVPFTVDIHDMMPGVDPDTVRATFISSIQGFCDTFGDGLCLYLSVDDLALSGPSAVEPWSLSPARVWVAEDGLHAEAVPPGSPIVLLDAMGRVVSSARLSAPLMPLPPLPTGLYTASVNGRAVRFVR